MNLRKVLAMFLTIAMVVGLVVVPTSAAAGETDLGLEAVLPSDGKPGDDIFVATVSQTDAMKITSTTATTLLGDAKIPAGGAIYYQIESITGYTKSANDYASIEASFDSGVALRLQLGVAQGNAFRAAKSGSGWDGVAAYSDISLDEGFELIVKENNKKLDFWVRRKDGKDFVNVLPGFSPVSGTKTNAAWITGNAKINLASAVIYKSKVKRETFTEDQVLPKSGNTYYKDVDTHGAERITSTPATGITTFSKVTTFPVNGAVHYKFTSVTGTDGSTSNYAFITEKALPVNGSNKGLAIQLGLDNQNPTKKNEIQVQSGTGWNNQLASIGDIDLTKPFEIIVKYDGTNFDYYLKKDGSDRFENVFTLPVGSANRTSNMKTVGNAVINLESATLYEFTEKTYTQDDLLPGAVYKTLDTMGVATVSGTTTTSFSKGYSIPVGGAVHYNIAGITDPTAAGTTDYAMITEDIDGGSAGRLAIQMGIGNAMRVQSNTGWPQLASYDELDLTKGFELIVKHDSNGFDFYVKAAGADGFKLIGTDVVVGNNNSSKSAVSVVGGTVLNLTSATLYRAEVDVDLSGTSELVRLTDGTGFTTDLSGGKLIGSSIRAIINPTVTSGALIFAGYAGDAVKYTEVVNVANISDNIEFVDVSDWVDATNVKVFLWEGIDTMKPVSDYTVKTFTK